VQLDEGYVAERERDSQKETRAGDDVRFEHGGRDYQFGEWCSFAYEKGVGDGETETVEVPFARHVWPKAVYRHVDEDDHGVRFTYRTFTGELEQAVISAKAFTSQSSARTAAGELAKLGVQITTDRGKEFAYGLGHWLEACGGKSPKIYLTNTPGWHKDGNVYVNGPQIFGAEGWFADETARAIVRRSGRSGAVERWTQKMDKLATTHAIRCAIGTALAGPLVELMHPHSFIVHFYGDSSCGKSTAAEAAASVVGTMDDALNSWYGTSTSKENLAEIADGFCLVLDELGQFSYSDKKVAEVIYNLASDQGKTRSTQSGDLQEQRSWKISVISTGEISMKDKVGQHRKGGQDVRMIDIPVGQGDVTDSAEHSDKIKMAVGAMSTVKGHAGVAGDLWVNYLVNACDIHDLHMQKRDEHRRLVDRFGDGTAETGRMLASVALVSVAMQEGHRVDFDHAPNLVPWTPEESRQAADWMAERAVKARTARTPNERALELLWEKVETKPAHFPSEQTILDNNAHKDVWGVSGTSTSQGTVYLSESNLKASGLPREAGIGVRSFLQWACGEGYARKESSRKRRAGRRCQWYVLKDDDRPDMDR